MTKFMLIVIALVFVCALLAQVESHSHLHGFKKALSGVHKISDKIRNKVLKDYMYKKVIHPVEKALHKVDIKDVFKETDNGCQCINYNCGCCAHVAVKKVKFDETVCVNVSYLPSEYGIRVTLTINDLVLINQTISAKNPPPLCAGVPHVKELSLCLRFYNLSISKSAFSGCVEIEAHVFHILEEKFKLGCFKIGQIASAQEELNKVITNLLPDVAASKNVVGEDPGSRSDYNNQIRVDALK